jgi:hypothetical protein
MPQVPKEWDAKVRPHESDNREVGGYESLNWTAGW